MQREKAVALEAQYSGLLNDSKEWLMKAEQAYNVSYHEQKVGFLFKSPSDRRSANALNAQHLGRRQFLVEESQR